LLGCDVGSRFVYQHGVHDLRNTLNETKSKSRDIENCLLGRSIQWEKYTLAVAQRRYNLGNHLTAVCVILKLISEIFYRSISREKKIEKSSYRSDVNREFVVQLSVRNTIWEIILWELT
jgi:hypothetical protein